MLPTALSHSSYFTTGVDRLQTWGRTTMSVPESAEERIVAQARARPEGERAAFLQGACGGDSALRGRIQARLDSAAQGEDSLGPTVVDPATPEALLEPLGQEGPGTAIGRYRLLEKIGEGGFGAVYVAEQKEPVKRRVAFKIIK